MPQVGLVTHDVQTIHGKAGGVGAFVTHWARLLKAAGDEVTIILTRQETHPVHVDEKWRARYRDWGVGLVELHNTEPSGDRWSDPWTARLSELTAPHLKGLDIVYFQDWANVAFRTARAKRFLRSPAPVLVTVLHGPSGWVRTGNKQYPEIPDDLHLDYIERYSALHSDFVVSPSRYMVEYLRGTGWSFQTDPVVLGLPYLAPEKKPAPGTKAATKRLVFFGRLETRKGFPLFVSSLRLLFAQEPAALQGIEEIVFLGDEQEPGAVDHVRGELSALQIPVLHVAGADSDAAQMYLGANASDSLVVVPSLAENFPYAVIEASSVPRINLLCSRGGGVPEVFDACGEHRLFEPYPAAFAGKLREYLLSPSLSAPAPVPAYDAAAANERWLQFHQRALRTASPGSAPPDRNINAPWRGPLATVDVCIPYFNKSEYFPQLLEALEDQTAQGFGVVAIDDGSEPGHKAAFDLMSERYRERGWKFVTQPNAFVDAARNRAASLSKADYLLFIDADDLPAPHAVERLLEAVTRSGDDCLVAAGLLMDGLPDRDIRNTRPLARYMPLGPDLVCALADPLVLGPSMIMIRRGVFEHVGGYRALRGAAHEDWELQIRLLMAGFRVDVLPEFLLYFRKTETGLSRTSSDYDAKQRLIQTYENELAKIGLRGVASTVAALLKGREVLEKALRESARASRLQGLVEEMLRRRTKGL
jgi:glycosyltransferase involved in cell wall biosynthesis/GT2 family glycosyltransferase